MSAVAAHPVIVCARCGRKLRHRRWVYSRFTGARYCPPGKGCGK